MDVTCYAGSHYPERPISFVIDGRRLQVVRVLNQYRTEEGKMFRVLASDGQRYRLSWNGITDLWAWLSETTVECGQGSQNTEEAK